MAVRTAQEIIGSMRDIFGEQTPDGFVELLEDITDSVGEVNLSNYVSKADYDSVVAERDKAVAGEKDMRDRYINRFYNGYDEPNDKGFIMGQASQESIEQEEEVVSYEDLFE